MERNNILNFEVSSSKVELKFAYRQTYTSMYILNWQINQFSFALSDIFEYCVRKPNINYIHTYK